jgi:hypothetical protein
MFPSVAKTLQYRLEQPLGCGGVAPGRSERANDFPLARSLSLSVGDMLFGGDVLFMFA